MTLLNSAFPVTADDVIPALAALRDAGLVTSRDHLNAAWSELTGRTVPHEVDDGPICQGCGHPGGLPYLEPRGTWHYQCWPALWAGGGSWMAAAECRVCGAPGGVPQHPSGRWLPPCCRDHAPGWLKSYLGGAS